MKNIYLIAFFALLTSFGYSQASFVSKAGVKTVSWNNPDHWDVFGTDDDGNNWPDANDDVYITDSANVTINCTSCTFECNNLFLNPNVYNTEDNAVLLITGFGFFGTGPVLNVLGDLTMEGSNTGSSSYYSLINIDNQKGKLTVSGDIIMSTFITNGLGAQIIFSKKGTINMGGNFSFPLGEEGKITGGNLGGTFNFNGSSTQTIPLNAATNFVFCNIISNNTSATGLTIDADLDGTNSNGNLTIAAGATFTDGGFNVVLDGDTDDDPAGNLDNSGTYNASGTLDIAGNFTNSGTFTSTGCNTNLEGNFTNSGTYTSATGDVFTFDGTTGTNTIDGATDWYELVINHTGTGVDVNTGAQTIKSILDLDAGTFSVDAAASLTLLSDATGTAQLDEIETGATWESSSIMTVQRYVAKVAQSFTSLGSPVSGTTLASWQDDNILYTGDGAGSFTGANYENFGWHNTYWYDEGAANGVMNDGFTKASTTAQAVGASNSYRAFHIYTDAIIYNLDVTGIPNTGNVTIPLAYDGGFPAAQAGWNLIANPYPCTIDFDAIFAAGMVNGYFVYNDGNANYDWYDGSDGSSLVSMTKFIPHTQGFWVRSTGLTSLPITESDKSRTDQAFYKSANANLMRIKLTGDVNNYLDATVIIENQGFSDNYEADVDIQKFLTLDPSQAPTISTATSDGYDVCFNRIPGNNISIPLTAKAGTTAQGNYTMTFDIPNTFMTGACITLEDLHTGNTVDLRTNTDYTYATSDTTTVPRFILHMVKNFNTEVVNLSCFETSDGEVAFDGTGITGSTFDLQDGLGNSVYSGVAVNDLITFSGVAGGTYEVITDYTGSCGTGSFFIEVIEPSQVIADFNFVQDTVYISQGGELEVNNLSLGTNFVWDFGDGSNSTDVNPVHTYAAPGIFQVMLTADNDNIGGCTQIISKNVVVMNGPLSIDDLLVENSFNAFVNSGIIVVDFTFESNTNIELSLIDINGKTIISKEDNVSSSRINLINTNEISSGVYFVKVKSNEVTSSKKLIVK